MGAPEYFPSLPVNVTLSGNQYNLWLIHSRNVTLLRQSREAGKVGLTGCAWRHTC